MSKIKTVQQSTKAGILAVLICWVIGFTQAAAQDLQDAKRFNDKVKQLYRQKKYSEAIVFARKSLTIREKVLGPHHHDVATSLNNLAFLYDAQSRFTSGR